MLIKRVFLEFSIFNHLVFSHKFELSLLYLFYADSLFVRVCIMIKSLDHKLFFIVLRLARGCGLERAWEFMFVVLGGTGEAC